MCQEKYSCWNKVSQFFILGNFQVIKGQTQVKHFFTSKVFDAKSSTSIWKRRTILLLIHLIELTQFFNDLNTVDDFDKKNSCTPKQPESASWSYLNSWTSEMCNGFFNGIFKANANNAKGKKINVKHWGLARKCASLETSIINHRALSSTTLWGLLHQALILHKMHQFDTETKFKI